MRRTKGINMNREKAFYESRKMLLCLIGVFIYSVGINLFVVPANLYSSGLLGICQVIRTVLVEYLHFPFQSFDIAGIIYYLINIPIMMLAIVKVGKKFLLKTLIAATAMTVFLAVIPIVPIVQDRMTACVVGGIITGCGVGIALRMGCTLGGIDVIGIVITRWKQNFSVGKLNLLVNFCLYAVCLFLFDVEVVIYSLIFAAVYAVAIDKVHIQNINVEVKIITKIDTALLEREVFEELNRGLTKWTSLGAYTHETSHVLYVLLSKHEVGRLKSIIHKYDANAFVVINEGVVVDGNYLKRL